MPLVVNTAIYSYQIEDYFYFTANYIYNSSISPQIWQLTSFKCTNCTKISTDTTTYFLRVYKLYKDLHRHDNLLPLSAQTAQRSPQTWQLTSFKCTNCIMILSDTTTYILRVHKLHEDLFRHNRVGWVRSGWVPRCFTKLLPSLWGHNNGKLTARCGLRTYNILLLQEIWRKWYISSSTHGHSHINRVHTQDTCHDG